ncbi:MAG TPA: ArsA-related P-loop ATPase [Ilumatobacter sp.]|nr:ArsA-related P-loop ATPase [Ilumatobacter sp.]
MATDERPWWSDTRVAIVAGKGGVGSSTVAAALALGAARDGADVLFISVDGRPGMGPLLGGRELDHTDRELRRIEGAGRIHGRTIPAHQAFGDYLEIKGIGAMVRRAAAAASLPMIAAATPGLEHLMVLARIKEFERERAADLIVVDAPAAGRATPFLRSALAVSDLVTTGPVREQADEVIEMLHDPDRARVMAVTLPEETPVTEALELAFEVDRMGIGHLPLVVNACWPDLPGLAKSPAMAARSHRLRLSPDAKRVLESAASFGRARLDRQQAQIERLRSSLEQPLVVLPRLPTGRLSPDDLEVLAQSLVAALVAARSEESC